jgi:hypothetical protein
MADNYTQFSVEVPLRKGKDVLAEVGRLIDEGHAERAKADEEGRYDDLDAIGFEFQYQLTESPLLLFAEEHGSPDDLVSFIEILLKRNLAIEPVMAEWAYTCSRARPGEFGGGGALITKTGTYWFLPSRFMELKWAQIKKQRNKPKRKKR